MVQHGDRQTGSIKPPGFFVSLKCPCPARLPQTAEAGQGRKTGKMNAIGLGPKSCCSFSSFWRRPTRLLVASGLVIQIDPACVCFCYVSQVFSCGEKHAGNCQTDFLSKIFLSSSIDSHLVESQVAPVQGLLQNSSSYYWSYLGPSSVWLFHLGKDVDRVL